MVKPARLIACALIAGLPLAACDSGPSDAAAPGAVSEGEAAALDEAAKMLDEQRLPEGVLPELDPPSDNQSNEATETENPR